MQRARAGCWILLSAVVTSGGCQSGEHVTFRWPWASKPATTPVAVRQAPPTSAPSERESQVASRVSNYADRLGRTDDTPAKPATDGAKRDAGAADRRLNESAGGAPPAAAPRPENDASATVADSRDSERRTDAPAGDRSAARAPGPRDEPRKSDNPAVKPADSPRATADSTATESEPPATNQPATRAPARPIKPATDAPPATTETPKRSRDAGAPPLGAPRIKSLKITPADGARPSEPATADADKPAAPAPRSSEPPPRATEPATAKSPMAKANEPVAAADGGAASREKIADLERMVADKPNDVESQLRLRMMYILDGQSDRALAATPGMDSDLHEVLRTILRPLIEARGSGATVTEAGWANRQIEALDQARKLLAARADLRVPTVRLCTEIRGYGQYKAIEPAEFPAGAMRMLLLYVEVENYKTERTPEGDLRSLMLLRTSLISAAGKELGAEEDDNIEDRSKQPRNGFFLHKYFRVPRTLPVGEYTVKAEIEDKLGHKTNSNMLHFRVVPGRTVVTKPPGGE